MALTTFPRGRFDSRFAVRMTNWEGGYDRLFYEDQDVRSEPRFWDSFCIESGISGELRLAPDWQAQAAITFTGSAPYGFSLPFNGSAYLFINETTNPTARRTADGVTYTTLAGAGRPTTGFKSGVVWRNKIYLAVQAFGNFHSLDASDVWATIPGPPVGGSAIDRIAVSPDDKLLVWANGKGLYSYDGTSWSARIWPSADPSQATCDLLQLAGGTVQIATSDSQRSLLHEYFVPEEWVVTWLDEKDLSFFCATTYAGAAYIGGKKKLPSGVPGMGRLWRKPRGVEPFLAHSFGDGIQGANPTLDFGVRALLADGETLWVGGLARTGDNQGSPVIGSPGVYRYEVDEQGIESISPNSFVGTGGDIVNQNYVIGVEQVQSAGVYRLVMFTTKGTSVVPYVRDVGYKAARGYLDSSILDLGAPDRNKTWRGVKVDAESLSGTETVTLKYRTGTLTGAFTTLGAAITTSPTKRPFPDDNAAARLYRLRARQVQIRTQLDRGGTTSATPRVTSIAADAAIVDRRVI